MEIAIWVSEDEEALLQDWLHQCTHSIVMIRGATDFHTCIQYRQVQLLIVSDTVLAHGWREQMSTIDWIAVTQTPSYEWAEDVMLSGASAFCSLPTTSQHIEQLINQVKHQRNYRLHNIFGVDLASAEIDFAQPIESAIIYISDHLAEHITLRDVSRAVYLSPSHFSRLFTQKVGIPFNEYLLTRRIDAAKTLLSETRLPIELIATKVGMTSASQFSQTFKRVTGLSPRAYRHASMIS
jgi:AraC-like DNA-binding protein